MPWRWPSHTFDYFVQDRAHVRHEWLACLAIIVRKKRMLSVEMERLWSERDGTHSLPLFPVILGAKSSFSRPFRSPNLPNERTPLSSQIRIRMRAITNTDQATFVYHHTWSCGLLAVPWFRQTSGAWYWPYTYFMQMVGVGGSEKSHGTEIKEKGREQPSHRVMEKSIVLLF